MNILFISKIKILPLNGGEKLRTLGNLKLLSSENNLVAILPEFNKDHLYEGIKSINFIHCKFYILFQLFPFFKDWFLMNKIKNALKSNHFDVVIIDYKFFGQYIQYFKTRNIPVIYSTHNFQSDLEFQKANESNWYVKYIRFFYAYLCMMHERLFFKNADRIWVTSNEDKKLHSKFIDNSKIDIIPNFLIRSNYIAKYPLRKENIIFSANFSSFQNWSGLKWFAENIWDIELSKKYKLILVGNGSDTALEKLKNKNLFVSNIMATGYVQDIKKHIIEAKCAIVPLINGSGTRLKILEAMALNTQIITTSIGGEGLLKNGIVIADTPETFKQAICDVMEDKINLVDIAKEDYLSNYTDIVVNKLILKSLKMIKTTGKC